MTYKDTSNEADVLKLYSQKKKKKRKIEEETDEENGPMEDNDAYNHLCKLTKKEVKDRYDKLYDRYLSDGENEDDAADMARERVKLA